jgi:putative lipoprotein
MLIRFCFVVASLALAACSPDPDASADENALPSTTWTVSSIGGVATVGEAQPTITFGADGQLNGTTGCNNYFGPYKLDGGTIEIGLLGSTLMLCEGPVGAQEVAFMAALPKATAWSIGSDGNLTLTGAADIIASPA